MSPAPDFTPVPSPPPTATLSLVFKTAETPAWPLIAAWIIELYRRGFWRKPSYLVVLHCSCLLDHPHHATNPRLLKLGTNADPNEAISLYRSVFNLCPVGHSNWSISLNSPVYHFSSRYEEQGAEPDLQSLLHCVGSPTARTLRSCHLPLHHVAPPPRMPMTTR